MPNIRSAKKRMRQDVKRRLANRQKRSAMNTAIRAVTKAAEAKDKAKVTTAVKLAYSKIDKAAKVRAIHANTASRRKALVTRLANSVSAG